MNDIKPTNAIPVPAYYIDNKEDEISLIDIFLVLFKRKMVILLTLLACTTLAVLLIFLTTEKTTFATSIKIGGKPAIESNISALTKLKESYIPITKDSLKDDDIIRDLKLKVRAPENSNLVIIETTTRTNNQDQVKELHQKIAERFIAEHNEELNLQQTAIENQIKRLQATLESLNNSTYLTTLRGDVISLRKQYFESDNISDNLKLDIKDELRFLQSKLIEEEQSTNMKTVDLQSSINELRYKLEITPKTSLLSLTLKSESKRTSPLMIIALGIILGGMLGIFAAFIVEFISKVKAKEKKCEELAKQNEASPG